MQDLVGKNTELNPGPLPQERRWRPCPSLLGSLPCERRGGWFAVKAAERFTFSSGEKAGMRADVITI
jgi:hypothetical protein